MDHLFLSMLSNYQEHPTFSEYLKNGFWNFLPPGYRFAPTDEELILYYLQRKILKQEMPLNKFREVNIYQNHPQDLADPQLNTRGENEWYFFTPRERKYANGKRPNRTANHGSGFWKVTGKDEAITSAADGEKIGYKNTLDYFEGTHSENQNSIWKMHEYRLKKSERDNEEEIAPANNQKGQRDDMKLDDCVLCKIYTSNRCKAGNIIIKKSKTAERPLFDSDEDGDVQHENQNVDSGIAHPAEPINSFIQNNTYHNMLSSFNQNVINFERLLTAEAAKKCKTEHHVPDGIQQSFYMPDDTQGDLQYDRSFLNSETRV